jgi:hypothetical protein
MPSFLSEARSHSASRSFGRREEAADPVVGLEDREGLLDDVPLVPLHRRDLAGLDLLDDPAGVEVHHEADAAAELAEVLDREPQAPRPGGPHLEPVGALREEFVGQGDAEELVVDPEVLDADAGLGHPGRSPGLEDVDRPVLVPEGHPAPHRPAAQPLVLEVAEAPEVGVARDLAPRVPPGALREVEPERRAGGRVEVPGHDLAHPGVERLAGRLLSCVETGLCAGAHETSCCHGKTVTFFYTPSAGRGRAAG